MCENLDRILSPLVFQSCFAFLHQEDTAALQHTGSSRGKDSLEYASE